MHSGKKDHVRHRVSNTKHFNFPISILYFLQNSYAEFDDFLIASFMMEKNDDFWDRLIVFNLLLLERLATRKAITSTICFPHKVLQRVFFHHEAQQLCMSNDPQPEMQK